MVGGDSAYGDGGLLALLVDFKEVMWGEGGGVRSLPNHLEHYQRIL